MRPISSTKLPANSKEDIKSLKKLAPYIWKYRYRTLFALLSLILAKVANVGVPMVFKEIVDALDIKNPGVVLLVPLSLVLAYGLLRAGASLFNELRDAIFARARHSIMRIISVELLEHLHKLSLSFHLERKTGALTRDMERGTSSINSLMNLFLFNVIPTTIEILLIAVILLNLYDPWFAIITFSTVLVYIVFTMLVTNWRMKFRVEMNVRDSEASSSLLDSIINFETVKYFNNEKYELNKYDEKLAKWEDSGVKSQTSMSALNFGQALIIAIGVTSVMYLAVKAVVENSMTIGDLVLINTFMLQLFIPLGFLGIVYSQVKHALADIHMMFKIFAEQPEISDLEPAEALNTKEYDIEFNDLHFAYNPAKPVLQGINFIVPNGKKVAIVGHSGSGKSTIAKLLFRLYEPTRGAIYINKQDIRNLTQESLRNAIGIVPQDTVLFNDTILNNVLYAKPEALMEDVINACKNANIHDFIESLPDGYQTVVGERGLKLSGGEKQRVAIARAILKSPEILVFDEATSSLDSITEKTILDNLSAIAKQHTTLVIAHRLSTVVDADNIIVLDQGRIIESGTHNNLLAAGGYYFNLWQKQQDKFLGEKYKM